MATELKTYYMKFPINNELNTKFRVFRSRMGLLTDDFIFNLLVLSQTPNEYQIKFEKKYKEGKIVQFQQRMSQRTFLKFRILSAYFPHHADTLDYLISNEEEKKNNSSLSDSDYSDSG